MNCEQGVSIVWQAKFWVTAHFVIGVVTLQYLMLVSKWKPSGGNKQITTLPETCYYGRDWRQERFGKNLMAQVTRVHLKVD